MISSFEDTHYVLLYLTRLYRDNGVVAIENLMKKKGKFDYILLETTGLADPGPIASIFWMDDDIGSDIYLDGIVTLVDSRNVRKVRSRFPSGTVLSAF